MIIRNAAQLICVSAHRERVKRGQGLRDLSIIPDGAVVVSDGIIQWVGRTSDLPPVPADAEVLDATGKVVLDRLAHHWDADEIKRQHPHLSLAQIYSALAYYYDHQAEIDREIEGQLQRVEKIRADLGASPIRQKLKAKGLLP